MGSLLKLAFIIWLISGMFYADIPFVKKIDGTDQVSFFTYSQIGSIIQNHQY